MLSLIEFTVATTVLTLAGIPVTSVVVEIVTCICGGSAKEYDRPLDRAVYCES